MSMTRNQFVGLFGLGLGAALLDPSRLLAGGAPDGPRLPELGAAAFRSQLETGFRIIRSDRAFQELVLKGVKEHDFGKRSEQFSIELVSLQGAQLQAGTYTFEHERLGQMQIYIVPTRTEASGQRTYFRADFNHLR